MSSKSKAYSERMSPSDKDRGNRSTSLPGVLRSKRSNNSPKRSKKWIAIASISLVLIIVTCGFSVLYASKSLPSTRSLPSASSLSLSPTASSLPLSPTAALVTITPANSNLKDIFDIQAVLGPPNASNRQIAARLISPTLPPHTESAQATGTGTVPGTHASGTVAIDNFNTASSLTLTAGSVFTNTYGAPIHMVLDATVTVPPAPSQTVWSQRLAPGHILEVGTIGNNEFNNNISGSISWSVFNSPPFSNGKDPVTYTAVQLSDINNAANALEQANTPNSQQVIQPLVHVNERLIGTPQCTPNVSSDHVTGDRSTSVTVTVTFTCTGEVYDYDAAMVMATNLLHTQASKQLGSGFALVGTIKTTLTNVALQDMQQKGIVLTIATEGFWVYRFNDTEKQALLKVIIGKSKQAAEDLLLKQSGVRMAQVSITSGNGNNLPIDIRQITLNIVSVPHP